MASGTVGTGSDFETLAIFEAQMTADAAVAEIGTLNVDEEYVGDTVFDASNTNGVPHGITSAPGVRHDGSGAESGARIAGIGTHTLQVSLTDFIIEDLLVLGTVGARRTILINAGGSRTKVQRCAIVQKTVNANSRCLESIAGANDLEVYLNNMFIAGPRRICNLSTSTGGKVIGNTFICADGEVAIQGLLLNASQQLVKGNIAVCKLTPGFGEYTAAGAVGSTQNAGEDTTAATAGSASYDFSAIGIDTDAICIQSTLSGLDMLREPTDHVLMTMDEDLSADIGILDVTGAEFDPNAMVVGAHQLALGDGGARQPFENAGMDPVVKAMAGVAE